MKLNFEVMLTVQIPTVKYYMLGWCDCNNWKILYTVQHLACKDIYTNLR